MTFAEELEILLEKELKALEKVLDLGIEKTDLITSNKIEDLDKTLKIEEKLINEIGLLEIERMKLLDTWGLEATSPISSIIERLPDNREAVVDLSSSMRKVLEKLNERNTLNNDLIQENLDWIDFNMNLITSIEAPTSYGKDKTQGLEKNRNSIFDRKV